MKKYILTLFISMIIFAFLPQKAEASILFNDNFDNGNANQWTPIHGPNLWQVNNNRYGAIINTGNTVIDSLAGNINTAKYIINMDITPLQGEDRNIDFRWINSGNNYEVHFNNDNGGTAYFVKGGPTQTGWPKTINYLLQNNFTYHIKVILDDQHVQFFVDNDKLFDVIDPDYHFSGPEQIGLKIGTGSTAPTEVYFDNIIVSSIDTDLTVPYLNQKDPPWGPHEYDSAASLGFSDTRFLRWGCAVTSVAMVLNYYGINQMANNDPLNPDTLNNWLKSHGGYLKGKDKDGSSYSSISWPVISQLTRSLVKAGKATTDLESSISTFSNGISLSQKIDDDLTNAQPDIVQVLTSANKNDNHFVVVKGKENNTYNINDPYYNHPDLTSFSNKFYELVQYVPSHTDLSYLVLSVNPKVNLLITDGQGNKTGKIFKNGQIQEFNQIPGANYYYEGPISNPNSQNQTEYLGTGANMFYLPKPISGQYKIELSSQTDEFYTANIQTFDTQGNQNLTTNIGSVTSSLSNSFILPFNASSSSTPQKQITFESTLKDIDTLTRMNLIKSKIYAAILTTAVKESQKQSTKNKLAARIAIDLFLAALQPERKRLLTEDAYQILLLDGQTLRKQLL